MIRQTFNFNNLAKKRDVIKNNIETFNDAIQDQNTENIDEFDGKTMQCEVEQLRLMSSDIEFDELEELGDIHLYNEDPNDLGEETEECLAEPVYCGHNDTLLDGPRGFGVFPVTNCLNNPFLSSDTMKKARECAMQAEKRLEEIYNNLDKKLDDMTEKLDKIMTLFENVSSASKHSMAIYDADDSSEPSEGYHENPDLLDNFEFNGNFESYESFIKLHKEEVEGKEMSENEKLQILRGHCFGIAEESIKFCHVLGDDGYQYALEILDERFRKKARLNQDSSKFLKNIDTIRFSDVAALSRLKDELLKLESLYNTDNKRLILDDELVLNEIVDKLNSSLNFKWEMFVVWKDGRDEEITFNTFIDFIEKEIENLSRFPQFSCVYCKMDNHFFSTCTVFKELADHEKKSFMFKHQICHFCYKYSHGCEECYENIPNFEESGYGCKNDDDKQTETNIEIQRGSKQIVMENQAGRDYEKTKVVKDILETEIDSEKLGKKTERENK